jgi:hypothetical protein
MNEEDGERKKDQKRMGRIGRWKRVIVRYSTVFHPNPKRIGVSE